MESMVSGEEQELWWPLLLSKLLGSRRTLLEESAARGLWGELPFLDRVLAHSTLSVELAEELLLPTVLDIAEVARESKFVPTLGAALAEMALAIALNFEVVRSQGQQEQALMVAPLRSPDRERESVAPQNAPPRWPEPQPRREEPTEEAEATYKEPPLKTLGDLFRREMARLEGKSTSAAPTTKPEAQRPAPTAWPPSVPRPEEAAAKTLQRGRQIVRPRRAEVVELPTTRHETPQPPEGSASASARTDVVGKMEVKPEPRGVPATPRPGGQDQESSASESPQVGTWSETVSGLMESGARTELVPPSGQGQSKSMGSELVVEQEETRGERVPEVSLPTEEQANRVEPGRSSQAFPPRESPVSGEGPASIPPQEAATSLLLPPVEEEPPTAKGSGQGLGALVAYVVRLFQRRSPKEAEVSAEATAGPAHPPAALSQAPHLTETPVVEESGSGSIEETPADVESGPDHRVEPRPVEQSRAAESVPVTGVEPRPSSEIPAVELDSPAGGREFLFSPGTTEVKPAPRTERSERGPSTEGQGEAGTERPKTIPPAPSPISPLEWPAPRYSRYALPSEPRQAFPKPDLPSDLSPAPLWSAQEALGEPAAGYQMSAVSSVSPLSDALTMSGIQASSPAMLPVLESNLPELVLAPAPTDRPATTSGPEEESAAPQQPSEGRAGEVETPDVDTLSREVYTLLKRRIAVERERGFGK